MKKTILLLLFCLPVTVKSQDVVIGLDKMMINGKAVDSTSLIADYIAILGQPNRVERLANNIYVYDELGIYIYESYSHGNKIGDVVFDFRAGHRWPFSPKQNFKGTITLTEMKFE